MSRARSQKPKGGAAFLYNLGYQWILRSIWQLGEPASETEILRGIRGEAFGKDSHEGFGRMWQP